MDFQKITILDGAMGTMLLRSHAPLSQFPEEINLTHPELVTAIHQQYIEAGADIVYANTFGANAYHAQGSAYTVPDIIRAAVANAKKAAQGTQTKVALSIGPTGQLLEPYGEATIEEVQTVFAEMVTAGEQAGADLIVFETFGDLNELSAGVAAAKAHSSLPVFATMTFEKSGRTFWGVTVTEMVEELEKLGVEALGVNCSLGPDLMLPVVRELISVAHKPVIVKANAGLPDPVTGAYNILPDQFSAFVRQHVALGAWAIGGCCGTTPDYIRMLSEEFRGKPVQRPF